MSGPSRILRGLRVVRDRVINKILSAHGRRNGGAPLKWFFAFNSDTPNDYQALAKVAVVSAQQHTNLDPYCIYDGSPSDTTAWLEHRGVKVIYHRSRFTEDVTRVFGKAFGESGSRGAFLRVEIPDILASREIDDEYVLYTDYDVMFVSDVDGLRELKPQYFSCAPELDQNNWTAVNTGVMLMNVKNLYRTYAEFVVFIRENLATDWVWDQTAYNLYYAGKIGKLPIEYNWKPYWGESAAARIIHFHGLKPVQRELLKSTLRADQRILLDLYNRNTDTYERMFRKWDEFLIQTAPQPLVTGSDVPGRGEGSKL